MELEVSPVFHGSFNLFTIIEREEYVQHEKFSEREAPFGVKIRPFSYHKDKRMQDGTTSSSQ